MSVGTDPGGTGDLHVRTLDGKEFDFPGGGHRRFLELSTGDVRVLGRLVEVPGDPPGSGRTYREGLDLYLGDRFQVYIACDGKVRVFCDGQYEFEVEVKCDTLDAPGHPGCTTEEPHPLMGVPHINLTIPMAPADHEAAGGLLADGEPGDPPAKWEEPG